MHPAGERSESELHDNGVLDMARETEARYYMCRSLSRSSMNFSTAGIDNSFMWRSWISSQSGFEILNKQDLSCTLTTIWQLPSPGFQAIDRYIAIQKFCHYSLRTPFLSVRPLIFNWVKLRIWNISDSEIAMLAEASSPQKPVILAGKSPPSKRFSTLE